MRQITPDFLELQTSQTIKIKVPDAVKVYVDQYLKTNIINFGERSGTYEQQKRGFISETMTHYYIFGVYKRLIGGFDGGIDFVYKGLNIDVKTSSRLGYIQKNYTALYIARQLKYVTDLVIFNNYNTTEDVLEICGWIFTKDIKNYGRPLPKNTKMQLNGNKSFFSKYENYEINYKDLNSIEILEQL